MKNNSKDVSNQIIFVDFFNMSGTRCKLLCAHQSLGCKLYFFKTR